VNGAEGAVSVAACAARAKVGWEGEGSDGNREGESRGFTVTACVEGAVLGWFWHCVQLETGKVLRRYWWYEAFVVE